MSGMKLKDYIACLSEEEYKDIFSNIEKEEKRLRKFLERFDEEQLEAIAYMMNDAFEMPSEDGMDVVDFIVELYKCQKADFFYENVSDAMEDIRAFILEEFE